MTKERAKLKEQINPMEDEQKEEASILIKLAYAEEGEACKYLTIRKVEGHDGKDEKERQGIDKVRCFLKHVKRQEEPRMRGGHHLARALYSTYPTWGKTEVKPMAKTLSLQTATR